MRTNQIETRITRVVDGQVKVFRVYADANNIYEALAAQNSAIIDKIKETEPLPSFGCVEVYDNPETLKLWRD